MPELALVEYTTCTELKPHSAQYHHGCGDALKDMNKHTDALLKYQDAINLDNTHVVSYNNAAISLVKLGDYDKAYKCFNKYLEVHPNDPQTQFGLSFVLLTCGY